MRRTKSQKLHLVTFFPVRFSSQDSQPARSETQSTIGSLRLSLDSDSDEGDIEERFKSVTAKMMMISLFQEIRKNLTLQKDILCNLDLKMCSSTPFLAVSTFERLFDNFSIDTGKLMKLIENVGESVPNFTETSRDSMCG